jgi:hypothetical protein
MGRHDGEGQEQREAEKRENDVAPLHWINPEINPVIVPLVKVKHVVALVSMAVIPVEYAAGT